MAHRTNGVKLDPKWRSDVETESLGGVNMDVKMGARMVEKEILQPGEVTLVGSHVGLETRARAEPSLLGRTMGTTTNTALQRMTGPGSLLLHGSLKNVVASKAKATRKNSGITKQTRTQRGGGGIVPTSRNSSSSNRDGTGGAMMTASTSMIVICFFLYY